MSCKECVHYVPCYEYGNILDPIHGGVKCDSFKSAADMVEVVRCKDCAECDHCYPRKDKGEEAIDGYYCCLHKRWVRAGYYCGDGERSEK
jgi:hypothetical protein